MKPFFYSNNRETVIKGEKGNAETGDLCHTGSANGFPGGSLGLEDGRGGGGGGTGLPRDGGTAGRAGDGGPAAHTGVGGQHCLHIAVRKFINRHRLRRHRSQSECRRTLFWTVLRVSYLIPYFTCTRNEKSNNCFLLLNFCQEQI